MILTFAGQRWTSDVASLRGMSLGQHQASDPFVNLVSRHSRFVSSTATATQSIKWYLRAINSILPFRESVEREHNGHRKNYCRISPAKCEVESILFWLYRVHSNVRLRS